MLSLLRPPLRSFRSAPVPRQVAVPCRRMTSIRVSPYAEGDHLGRSLSKPINQEVDPATLRRWTKMIDEKSRIWNRPPPINHYSLGYEMDALDMTQRRSFDANVLLEVRDVRLPASTHHPSYTRLAKHRHHLICYTHSDLIDSKTKDRVLKWTLRSWPKADCKFVDTRSERPKDEFLAYKEVYEWIMDTLKEKKSHCALTVGVPNTGKSSLLKSLLTYGQQSFLLAKNVRSRDIDYVFTKKHKEGKKKAKKLRAGSMPHIQNVPGVTRKLTEYLMAGGPNSKNTKYYLLDVPGISPPWFFFKERPEALYGYGAANLLTMDRKEANDGTLKLAFCEYLLHCLNRDGHFEYVKKLGLDRPTTDIQDVLSRLKSKQSKYEGAVLRKKCETFLKLFETGNLGPAILDDLSKPFRPFVFKDEHFRKREPPKRKDRGGDDFDDEDMFEGGGRKHYEAEEDDGDSDDWNFERGSSEDLPKDFPDRRATGFQGKWEREQRQKDARKKRGKKGNKRYDEEEDEFDDFDDDFEPARAGKRGGRRQDDYDDDFDDFDDDFDDRKTKRGGGHQHEDEDEFGDDFDEDEDEGSWEDLRQ